MGGCSGSVRAGCCDSPGESKRPRSWLRSAWSTAACSMTGGRPGKPGGNSSVRKQNQEASFTVFQQVVADQPPFGPESLEQAAYPSPDRRALATASPSGNQSHYCAASYPRLHCQKSFGVANRLEHALPVEIEGRHGGAVGPFLHPWNRGIAPGGTQL